jgi:prepilin-type N-terminal cleavage/methylation domain-containing protein
MNRSQTIKKNAAFTLVELLIAVALLGFGINLVYTQVSTLKKLVARMQLKRQITDLRDFVMQKTDCSQTLLPFIQPDGSIICNSSITLKDDANSAFTQNSVKNFQITASCSSATAITVSVASSVGAKDPLTRAPLNQSNTMLNPLIGRGSAYGLCENFFRNKRRVRVFIAPSNELAFSSTECDRMLDHHEASAPTSLSRANYEAMIKNNAADYVLVNSMDARCGAYCRSAPRFYISGYLADCNSLEATCVCFR